MPLLILQINYYDVELYYSVLFYPNMRLTTTVSLFLLVLPILGFSQKTDSTTSLVDIYSLDDLVNMRLSSADKLEQRIQDVPANVEILTRRDIENYGFANLNDLLRNITGFYNIEDHYWLGSMNYGVRGHFNAGPFSNVAILVNGVNQISDKYLDFPDVKITVPIEAIERIEIIKGPMAIVYGNGAFFGSINIITSGMEANKKSQNIVSASVGNYDNLRASLKIEDQIKDFSYSVIASANATQGLDQPFTEITTDNAYLEYVGQQPGETLDGKLALSKYYAGARLTYKDLVLDFNYNESNKGSFDGGPSRARGNRINTSATNLFMKYSKSLSEKVDVSAALGYYIHSHMLTYDLFFDYYYELDYQRTSSIDYDVNIKWQPNAKVSLLSGLYRRTVISLKQISDFGYYGLDLGDGISGLPNDQNYSNNAVYSQLNIKLHPKLLFHSGFRLEKLDDYHMYNVRGIVTENPEDNRPVNDPRNRRVIEAKYEANNNGFLFMPRLALIYEFIPQNYLKAIYSTAQKQASFSEEYRQLPDGRPSLNASQINTAELIYYSTSLDNWVISLSGFYNRLDDLIINTNNFDPTTGEWKFFATNSGESETIGLEYLINYKPSKKLRIKTSGTFQKTTDLRPGFKEMQVAYSPTFLAYTNIMYSVNQNFRLSVNNRFIGSMLSEWVSDSTPEMGYRLGAGTESMMVFDLNFRYDNFIDSGYFMNFKVNNVFNRQVRYPTTTSNSWIDRGALDFGFQALLSIGKLF